MVNDGYSVMRSPNRKSPDFPEKSASMKIKNIGLSTAFNINTFILKIEEVKGLSSLDDISSERIREITDNFYDKFKRQIIAISRIKNWLKMSGRFIHHLTSQITKTVKLTLFLTLVTSNPNFIAF